MKSKALLALATLLVLPPIAAQVDPLAPEEVPDSVTSEANATLGAEDRLAGDNGRIVNGEAAPKGSAPWQIEIFSPHSQYSKAEREADALLPRGDARKLYLAERDAHELAHRCGGAYIGEGWIVTAAHCVPALDMPPIDGRARTLFSDLRIRMGTQILPTGREVFENQTGEVYEMERIVVHKDYSGKTKVNDIALIKVKEAGQTAQLGARLQKVTLPDPAKPLTNNDDVWVYGWGWMAPRAPEIGKTPATAMRQGTSAKGLVTQRNPVELQMAGLKNVNETVCKPYYPNWGPGMLCVSAAKTGRDSCQGDSGGPLIYVRSGVKVLVGIVSNGFGCAYKDYPAAYTKVSAYLGWIGDVQKIAKPGFSRL